MKLVLARSRTTGGSMHLRRTILAATLLVLLATVSNAGAAIASSGASPDAQAAPDAHVVATVAVGIHPNGIAVDPFTHTVYVANGLSDSVSIIDGMAARVTATVPVGHGPDGVAVDPSAHTVYVANRQGGSISVLDGMDGRVMTTLPIQYLAGLAVDPSTHTVYAGVDSSPITNSGAAVEALDGPTGRVLATIPFGGNAIDRALRNIDAVAVDPATQTVYVGTSEKYPDESAIIVLDMRTRQQVATIPTEDFVNDIAVDATSHRVLVTVPFPFQTLDLFDGATPLSDGAKPVTLHLGKRPLDVAADPTTQTAYVSNADDNTVSVVDENANQVVETLPLGAVARNPGPLTVDPSTHTVYIADQGSNTVTILAGLTQPPSVPHDARYFPQTGYRIDNDVIWDYCNRRGGVPTFGYPTSRTFLFQGFTVQFFQRRIVQLDSSGHARILNLLDSGLMPYTSFNGSTFPAVDSSLVSTAPDPMHQPATLAWVQAHAPNSVNGAPTDYDATFQSTVTAAVAFPNGGDASLLPGFDLELWGVPTSQPAVDPQNHHFVYLRWQRGIMHYDAGCACTQGVLLADYFKAILTGRALPADLAQEAKDSPFLGQHDPSAPNWVRNPRLLPGTDLTNAFTPE